jgi:hypothetical protein
MGVENRWSFVSVNRQILGATAQNLVTTATWHPGFRQACADVSQCNTFHDKDMYFDHLSSTRSFITSDPLPQTI